MITSDGRGDVGRAELLLVITMCSVGHGSGSEEYLYQGSALPTSASTKIIMVTVC